VRLDSLKVSILKKDIAKIESASVTLKEDVSLNYYVTLGDDFLGATMYFTMNGETYDVEGKEVEGRYQFSFDLPPQYMADEVQAVLKLGDTELGRIENYSIQQYVQNQLNELVEKPNGELKQLLTDMLYYGAAAQTYRGYNVENLATKNVENLGTPSTAKPEKTDFTLVKNTEITEYPAYFKGAGVRFADVNKIYVALSTTENVTLTINGKEVEEITGTTVYTDGILATEFDTTYTFVLSCNGVVMQTLTYSVNAYAYAKQNDAKIGQLALALYNYGLSAKAYNG
jgi:archaellum component FlaF (FlaF/FlaG flagellin family)